MGPSYRICISVGIRVQICLCWRVCFVLVHVFVLILMFALICTMLACFYSCMPPDHRTGFHHILVSVAGKLILRYLSVTGLQPIEKDPVHGHFSGIAWRSFSALLQYLVPHIISGVGCAVVVQAYAWMQGQMQVHMQ